MQLCKAGGSKSFLELVEYAHLESPFKKETVGRVMEKVGVFLESIDDTKLN